MSNSRILLSYKDISIVSEGLQNLGFRLAPMAIWAEMDLFQSIPTCYYRGPQFTVSFKDSAIVGRYILPTVWFMYMFQYIDKT